MHSYFLLILLSFVLSLGEVDTRFSFCAFASLKLLVGCTILHLTYIYVCLYQKNPSFSHL